MGAVSIHKFFNPKRFLKILDFIFKPLLLITFALLIYGLWQALYVSPPDYQQGELVRIMYVHVPSASLSLFIYLGMAISSVAYLVWKNPLSYYMAKSLAPIGACFCFITLATGSIWGKETWGAWWIWQDARLVSMLLLFFLYLGYIILQSSIADRERLALASSIIAILGAINLSLIHI